MRPRQSVSPQVLLGYRTATAISGRTRAPERAAACVGSELDVWLNTRGDGAAGSTFYALEFTNLSSHSCTLTGFPRVSAIDLTRSPDRACGDSRQRQSIRTITLAGSSTQSLGDTGTVGPKNRSGRQISPQRRVISSRLLDCAFIRRARSRRKSSLPFEACSQDDATLMIEAVQK